MSYYTHKYPIPPTLPQGDKDLIMRAYTLDPDADFRQEKAETEEARTILDGIARDKWYHRKCREDDR